MKKNKDVPTKLATALRLFFAKHLPLTRGLSPRTVLSYRDTFVLLLRFLSAHHGRQIVELEFQHVNADSVLVFLDHLEQERSNCVATRNARLAAIHTFSRFVAIQDPEHVESAQRLLAIPIKRGPTRAVDYLEGNEIAAMLAAVSSRRRQCHRDRALLLTLFNTGGRVQEVLDIRPNDLQLNRPASVRLIGKGRKERLCPLWPETVDALTTLLSKAPAVASDAPVFRNQRGEPMTRFGIRYLLRQYADAARQAAPTLANKRVHPHTYRHSAAVHLLRAGVDLVTISHWLGHASVETTNRYTAVDLATKREALERAGPVTGSSEPDVTGWRKDDSVLEWLESL
jgi:site-specific recombinase XerD